MTLRWHSVSRGLLSTVDWSNWLHRDKPIDPYLVWADVTRGIGLSPPDATAGADRWPIIVELSREDYPAPASLEGAAACRDVPDAETVPLALGCMEISAAYRRKSAASCTGYQIDGRYITARVDPMMLEHLLRAGEVVRFQLGLPRIPAIAPGALVRDELNVDRTQWPRVVVGVIDDGCAFAHPMLADHEGVSRVRYLWDQDHRRQARDEDPKSRWRKLEDFAYGAELGPGELRQASLAAPGRDEHAPYRDTQFGRYRLDIDTHASAPIDAAGRSIPVVAQLAGSHGTSVSDLAAGHPPPLRGLQAPWSAPLAPRAPLGEVGRRQLSEVIATQAGTQAGMVGDADLAAIDTADQWDIVFVQLPSRTVADTSGGSLAVHVLDALRYIEWRALKLPYEGFKSDDDDVAGGTSLSGSKFTGNGLVVNLSYGATAGGHDGTSILECAIQDRIRLREVQSLFVVAAAGNANRARGHVEFEFKPRDRQALVWTVGPDNPLDAFLEIWLPHRDVQGRGLSERLAHELLISVTAPSGHRLPTASLGNIWTLGAEGAAPEAGLVFCRRVAQSTMGTMVLLVCRATRSSQGHGARAAGLHGDWFIELAFGSEDAAPGPAQRVHAWAERNDLVLAQRRGPQARVDLDPPVADPTEFHADALDYLRHGEHASDHRAPYGLRPAVNLSSIASVTSADGVRAPAGKFMLANAGQGRGWFINVGAYRIADGEMSPDSGGGPDRHYTHDRYWDALKGRPPSRGAGLLRPDADAPSDVSPAVPGVRTAGLLPASTYRISGTSAAAASVTRLVANVLYWNLNESLRDVGFNVARLMLQPQPLGKPLREARATLTPTADDAFRKGAARVR